METNPNALAKCKVPAIIMIVLGLIAELFALWGIAKFMMQGSAFSPEEIQQMQDAGMGSAIDVLNSLGLAFPILAMIVSTVVIFGAIGMIKGERRVLAILASIGVMLPLSCCCLVGLPVGVWSLIVLMKPDVKAAFRS